ncbi:MAG: hypothetical protein HN560_05140 [Anaerolineae bacterium]|jgi:phosphatidylglycerol---prolipoprotein diacylglyceryl transferase|nr:hypothetical protein [Anaerolineae bacterium]
MYPILFALGSFSFRTSYLFILLGAFFGILVGLKETKRVGFPMGTFRLYWIIILPLALLFSLSDKFIFNNSFFYSFQNLEILLSFGLVSSFGVIWRMLLLGYLIAKWKRENSALLLDLISLTIPLSLGIYRIGCLLNGCCYGLETDSFWGIFLPGHSGIWANRYPTQIWLLLFNFMLFGWLWSRRKSKSFDGHLTLSYLILFSLGRLLIDAFRELPDVLSVFNLPQIMAITTLLIALYIYLEINLSKRSKIV